MMRLVVGPGLALQRPICGWPSCRHRLVHRRQLILCCADGLARTDTAPKQVVVVGGGAAGLTAAYFAAEQGAQVRAAWASATRAKERWCACGRAACVCAVFCEVGGWWVSAALQVTATPNDAKQGCNGDPHSTPPHPTHRHAHAQVTVLEKTDKCGKKIVISGGMRCNILPQSMDIDTDFFSESSRSALRAVFASWSLQECKEW